MGLPTGPEQSLTDQGADFQEKVSLGQHRSKRSNQPHEYISDTSCPNRSRYYTYDLN